MFSKYLNSNKFIDQQSIIIQRLIDNPLVAKIINHFTAILFSNRNQRLHYQLDSYLTNILSACTQNDSMFFSTVIDGYTKLKNNYPGDTILFQHDTIIEQIRNNLMSSKTISPYKT